MRVWRNPSCMLMSFLKDIHVKLAMKDTQKEFKMYLKCAY